jgi:hypothetical protein
MERHPNDLTTDEEIDEGIACAKQFANEPKIVEAVYRSEPDLDLLVLRLSDGRRLVFPREELPELKDATPEQLTDFRIGLHGVNLWWPQLDDGIYLPNLLRDMHQAAHSGVAA